MESSLRNINIFRAVPSNLGELMGSERCDARIHAGNTSLSFSQERCPGKRSGTPAAFETRLDPERNDCRSRGKEQLRTTSLKHIILVRSLRKAEFISRRKRIVTRAWCGRVETVSFRSHYSLTCSQKNPRKTARSPRANAQKYIAQRRFIYFISLFCLNTQSIF